MIELMRRRTSFQDGPPGPQLSRRMAGFEIMRKRPGLHHPRLSAYLKNARSATHCAAIARGFEFSGRLLSRKSSISLEEIRERLSRWADSQTRKFRTRCPYFPTEYGH